jgi:hypothetical protein
MPAMTTTLGEGLSRRADLQKRVAQLEDRLRASALVQEGEQPPERPEELIAELGSICDELERLIARINHTNATTKLPNGETVTEALARRDVLALRTGALRSAIRGATDTGPFGRYSRSEIRLVRQIDVGDLRRFIDDRAGEQRQLDNMLQEHNWTTPLIE